MKNKTLAQTLLVTTLFFSNQLFALDNLIISDIDDTVKITHSGNKSDAIQNASIIENHFLLMPQLLNYLAEGEHTKISYVSKSPTILNGKITEMLNYGNFPEGPVYTRKNIFDSKYKITTISKILETLKPKRVIFFGDNGQDDRKDYEILAQKFSNIEFFTYIRIAYNSPENKLKKPMVGFTTPLEVLIDLHDKKLILQNTALLEVVAAKINQELSKKVQPTNEPTLFPHWYKCSQFKWVWKKNFSSPTINTAIAKVINNCSTNY